MEKLEDVVNYRLEKSNEALEEAQVLANTKHYNTAVSDCTLQYSIQFQPFLFSFSLIIKGQNILEKSYWP